MRYFFDIDDGDGAVTDDEGVHFRTLEEAQAIGAKTLASLALEALPNGGHRRLSLDVRDESGRVVYRAFLEFGSERPG
ncbi:DUF6894 family protein [Chthonobacter rhizosphaerae]|uniref:DUF6894 family protein n=1 Tax=Chthonobacter rhizosphaerae TaxID=2735553 RepID=UPI0015EED7E6|nr:hypothetical protein [Chthonobacter rhizosphaerae]